MNATFPEERRWVTHPRTVTDVPAYEARSTMREVGTVTELVGAVTIHLSDGRVGKLRGPFSRINAKRSRR
jgi:hypothetical protein